MLLSPHHFQQWDNFYEELLNSRLASLSPYEWGILDLQVNRESVANGSVGLVRLRAVMPDGLLLNIPQTDPAPDARPIEGHFDAEAETLAVHLAIPAKRAGAANFQTSGGAPERTALGDKYFDQLAQHVCEPGRSTDIERWRDVSIGDGKLAGGRAS